MRNECTQLRRYDQLLQHSASDVFCIRRILRIFQQHGDGVPGLICRGEADEPRVLAIAAEGRAAVTRAVILPRGIACSTARAVAGSTMGAGVSAEAA